MARLLTCVFVDAVFQADIIELNRAASVEMASDARDHLETYIIARRALAARSLSVALEPRLIIRPTAHAWHRWNAFVILRTRATRLLAWVAKRCERSAVHVLWARWKQCACERVAVLRARTLSAELEGNRHTLILTRALLVVSTFERARLGRAWHRLGEVHKKSQQLCDRAKHVLLVRALHLGSVLVLESQQKSRAKRRAVQRWLRAVGAYQRQAAHAYRLESTGECAAALARRSMREGTRCALSFVMRSCEKRLHHAWRRWMKAVDAAVHSATIAACDAQTAQICVGAAARAAMSWLTRGVRARQEHAWARWRALVGLKREAAIAKAYDVQLARTKVHSAFQRAAAVLAASGLSRRQHAWVSWCRFVWRGREADARVSVGASVSIAILERACSNHVRLAWWRWVLATTAQRDRTTRAEHSTKLAHARAEMQLQRSLSLLLGHETRTRARAWRRWASAVIVSRHHELREVHEGARAVGAKRDGLLRAVRLVASYALRLQNRAWRRLLRQSAEAERTRSRASHEAELHAARTNATMRRALNIFDGSVVSIQQGAWHRWVNLVQDKRRDAQASAYQAALAASSVSAGLRAWSALVNCRTAVLKQRAWRSWLLATAAQSHTSDAAWREAQVQTLRTEAVIRSALQRMAYAAARRCACAWGSWRDVVRVSRHEQTLDSCTTALSIAVRRDGAHRAVELMANHVMRAKQRSWRSWLRFSLAYLRSQMRQERAAELFLRCVGLSQLMAWRRWHDLMIRERHHLLRHSHRIELRARTILEGMHRAASLVASASLQSTQRAWRCWVSTILAGNRASEKEQHRLELQSVHKEATMRRVANMHLHRAFYLQQLAWWKWRHGVEKVRASSLAVSAGAHRASQLLAGGSSRLLRRAWRCWGGTLPAHVRQRHFAELQRLHNESAMRRIFNHMGRGVMRLHQRAWSRWAAEVRCLQHECLVASHTAILEAAALRDGLCRAAKLISSANQRLTHQAWRCWSGVLVDYARKRHSIELHRLEIDSAMRRILNQMGRGITRLLQRSWGQWCASLNSLRRSQLSAAHAAALEMAGLRVGLQRVFSIAMHHAMTSRQRAWLQWVQEIDRLSRKSARVQHETELRAAMMNSAVLFLAREYLNSTRTVLRCALRRWSSMVASRALVTRAATLICRVARGVHMSSLRASWRQWQKNTSGLATANAVRTTAGKALWFRLARLAQRDVSLAFAMWAALRNHRQSAEQKLRRAAAIVRYRAAARCWRKWQQCIFAADVHDAQKLRVTTRLLRAVWRAARVAHAWQRWRNEAVDATCASLRERLGEVSSSFESSARTLKGARLITTSLVARASVARALRELTRAWRIWLDRSLEATASAALLRGSALASVRETAERARRSDQALSLRRWHLASALQRNDASVLERERRRACVGVLRRGVRAAVTAGFRKWVLSAHQERLVAFLDELSNRISAKSMQRVAFERVTNVRYFAVCRSLAVEKDREESWRDT